MNWQHLTVDEAWCRWNQTVQGFQESRLVHKLFFRRRWDRKTFFYSVAYQNWRNNTLLQCSSPLFPCIACSKRYRLLAQSRLYFFNLVNPKIGDETTEQYSSFGRSKQKNSWMSVRTSLNSVPNLNMNPRVLYALAVTLSTWPEKLSIESTTKPRSFIDATVMSCCPFNYLYLVA
jgi:hypothetical protein